MISVVVYVRVPKELADFFRQVAEETGVSLTQVWTRAGERYMTECFGKEPSYTRPTLP